MKYAWIENNVIRDVCPGTPSEYYTPNIAAFYDTEVNDSVQNGWSLVGSTWTAPVVPGPEPAPEPANVYPSLTPVQFKLLFTSSERIAIKTTKITDEILADVFDIIDDPRLTEVDLGLASTQQTLEYLVSIGILAESRMAEILTGVLK